MTRVQNPRARKGRKRYIPKPKPCSFCLKGIQTIDYKDVSLLGRYLSDRARIEPRRRTGTCAKHQRALSPALKRARHLALLPLTPAHIRNSGGLGLRGAS